MMKVAKMFSSGFSNQTLLDEAKEERLISRLNAKSGVDFLRAAPKKWPSKMAIFFKHNISRKRKSLKEK
jgi:hypothetical protein